MVKSRKKT